MRPMYKSKAGSPTGSGQKAKSIIKRLESTCFRAFLANHANNDTKCPPGLRRGAFYSARGAFFGGGVHFLGVGCILQLLCESNWDFLYPTVSVESQNTSRKIIPRKVYDLFFPYTFIEFFIGFQSESLDRIEQKTLIVLFARIVELNSIVHKIVDEVEFPPICIFKDECRSRPRASWAASWRTSSERS